MQLHVIHRRLFLQSGPILERQRSLSSKNRAEAIIVFSSKNRRRRDGPQRFLKFVLEAAAPLVAANLNILPPPLDILIREFYGAGNGSGGRRGSGGGWFAGWRGGRRKLDYWWMVVVFGLGMLVGSEIENRVVCGILGVGFVGAVLVGGWSKRIIRNGILGLCLVGALVALGRPRKELQGWVNDFKARSPLMNTWSGGRRRRKSAGRFF